MACVDQPSRPRRRATNLLTRTWGISFGDPYRALVRMRLKGRAEEVWSGKDLRDAAEGVTESGLIASELGGGGAQFDENGTMAGCSTLQVPGSGGVLARFERSTRSLPPTRLTESATIPATLRDNASLIAEITVPPCALVSMGPGRVNARQSPCLMPGDPNGNRRDWAGARSSQHNSFKCGRPP